MDKQTAIQQIRELIQRSGLTKSELENSIEISEPKSTSAQIFYYIGGIVVLLGVGILVGEHWKELSVWGKLLATLGIAFASYIAGVIINQKTPYKKLADTFFCLSALLSPLGFYIAFQQAGIRFSDPSLSSLVSCVLLAAYLASYFLYRRSLFVIFSVIFGTWFFYSFTAFLATGTSYMLIRHVAEYKSLAIGLSYLAFGYYFSKVQENLHHNSLSVLTPWLYSLGSLATLLSTLFLTGWQPNQSIVWEIVYPFILFGFMYASTKLKSKSFLIFGSIFMVAYLWKLTFEYFKNSLGWPLTFIIGGFVIIGIGFLSFRLNKKYLNN